MPCLQFFYIANVSFNAIRENKILSKISEFAVLKIDLGGVQHIVQHILGQLFRWTFDSSPVKIGQNHGTI